MSVLSPSEIDPYFRDPLTATLFDRNVEQRHARSQLIAKYMHWDGLSYDDATAAANQEMFARFLNALTTEESLLTKEYVSDGLSRHSSAIDVESLRLKAHNDNLAAFRELHEIMPNPELDRLGTIEEVPAGFKIPGLLADDVAQGYADHGPDYLGPTPEPFKPRTDGGSS